MALSFTEIWEQIKRKKGLGDDSNISGKIIKIDALNLKILLQQVYEQGQLNSQSK